MQDKPKIKGPAGQAWVMDMRAASEMKAHAGVAWWVVEAAWAHPLWSRYAIACIHLRPLEGFGPPRIYREGATHEVTVAAIDPDWRLDTGSRPLTLEPLNFAGQFAAESDEAAAERIEMTVREIVAGTLNPDTDGRRQWTARFGDDMVLK